MNNYDQQNNAANAWADFNDAQNQQAFDVIAKGTLVRVRMTLKPGGFDSVEHGWTGGYATQSDKTDAVYLSAEFVITEGEFARRKVWSMIGLYSPKGPDWGNSGRAFVRAILNSSRNLLQQDNSQQANAARRITGFVELDGIEFLAKLDIELDQHGQPRNVIKVAIQPDHKDYARLMGVAPRLPLPSATGVPGQAGVTTLPQASQPTNQAPAPRASQPAGTAAITARPSWAQ